MLCAVLCDVMFADARLQNADESDDDLDDLDPEVIIWRKKQLRKRQPHSVAACSSMTAFVGSCMQQAQAGSKAPLANTGQAADGLGQRTPSCASCRSGCWP
jgi:hypothetical protein